MGDDLDKLVARGKAKERQREAEAARDRDAKVVAQARERDHQTFRALSPFWGLLTGDLGWFYAMVLVFVPATVATIVVLVELQVSDRVAMIIMPGHGRLYLPFPAILVTVLVMRYARAAGRRAVAREHAFLAALPFTVTGYIECLGSYYSHNESSVILRFEFESEKPPPRLREILAADGGTWKVSRSRAKRDPGPRTSFKQDHNRKVVRWFHRLLAEQLLPLHREYPIRAIHVSNDDRDIIHEARQDEDAT